MILTVINQKGGVGKTTTSVNLAYVLSRRKRVALMDLDPEGGATTSLGMRRDKGEFSVGGKSVNLFNMDVYMSHVGLLKEEMSGDVEEVSGVIKKIGEGYDVLVIDTPPNLGTLSVSAMVASDRVLAPVMPQFLSLEAVKNLGSRLQSLGKFAYAFTNAGKRPISLEAESVKFLDISVPLSKLFQDAVRLGVPAVKYEEVRIKRGKLGSTYEQLGKLVTEAV